VSAATLAKMMRQKETFLLGRTHIATHTRQCGRSEMARFGHIRGDEETQTGGALDHDHVA